MVAYTFKKKRRVESGSLAIRSHFGSGRVSFVALVEPCHALIIIHIVMGESEQKTRSRYHGSVDDMADAISLLAKVPEFTKYDLKADAKGGKSFRIKPADTGMLHDVGSVEKAARKSQCQQIAMGASIAEDRRTAERHMADCSQP